ncbi:MAG: hypothetical protein Q9198_005694 [Flavoplaca austrocitrina]
MEVINTAPTESQFTPLSTHQSQTPASFHSGPPVLHHRSPSTTILINSNDLESAPAFHKLAPPQRSNGSAHAATNEDEGHEITINGLDIWVTSERFLVFSPTLSTGVSIPYPSISLHAIQRSSTIPSLLLQLLISSGPQFDDHDPEGTISIAIIPQNDADSYSNEPPPPPMGPRPAVTEDMLSRIEQLTPVEQLFRALSACADLHPDHDLDSDFDLQDDGPNEDSAALYTQVDGLPPPMPGSGGWITAENVGDYFDEEGNYMRAGEGLGEGAGRVRGRQEDDEEALEGVDGNGLEDHEGEGEETKWRRTG